MTMRKEFVNLMSKLYESDHRLVTVLGDIGVFGFKDLSDKFSGRVINIGILEQSMVSFAAGLSKAGLIPVVHTIAPFLVERAYEQLKIDFGYQQLAGNFVSVGGSYDYAALGCTHHCPGDIQLMKAIPGMQVIVPGTSKEFSELFLDSYSSKSPKYFRLSESENTQSVEVEFGHANIIQEGTQGTVIVVGPMLDIARAAAKDYDVNLLYYTTLAPFDSFTLRETLVAKNILVIEPFFEGTLHYDISAALQGLQCSIETVGVPRTFLNHYGRKNDHDRAAGLTVENIQSRIAHLVAGLEPRSVPATATKDLVV